MVKYKQGNMKTEMILPAFEEVKAFYRASINTRCSMLRAGLPVDEKDLSRCGVYCQGKGLKQSFMAGKISKVNNCGKDEPVSSSFLLLHNLKNIIMKLQILKPGSNAVIGLLLAPVYCIFISILNMALAGQCYLMPLHLYLKFGGVKMLLAGTLIF